VSRRAERACDRRKVDTRGHSKVFPVLSARMDPPGPGSDDEHTEIVYLIQQANTSRQTGLLDRRHLQGHLTCLLEEHLSNYHGWTRPHGESSLDELREEFRASHPVQD
jgi:hypothetical protein